MASSVPSRPSYFLRTASRSIRRPSASSPMATLTPPAPKSLHRLMRRVTALSRNRRWILRSSGALPFWTSEAMVERDFRLWLLEEPVAPPMPSRPVRPPSRMTTSPGRDTHGGHYRREPPPPPRRIPDAWRCSPRGTAPPHGRWPGRSGCRRRNSPRRRSGTASAEAACRRGSGPERHGVTRAGHPHGLMDVGTAGQGVPDAAADAGGRAAEGLDLRGVVVGLIFEHQQPVLGLAVHRGGDVDGAGIDLLALVQLRQQAPLFQDLRADGGNVHQGLRPLGGLFLAVDFHPCGQIPLVGGLNGRVVDLHLVDVGGEGGVAAVVGTIGVSPPRGRWGGAPPPPRRPPPASRSVRPLPGKTQLVPQSVQRGSVHGGEALHGPDGGGDVIFHPQGLRQLQRRLPGSPPG